MRITDPTSLVVLIVATALIGAATDAIAAVPTAQKTEAAALSTVAMKKAGDGQFKVAAAMFQEAFALDPETFGYLYSAARAAHKGKDWAAAERDYQAFIDKAPGDHDFMSSARRHLDSVRAARKAESAAKPAPATPAPSATPEQVPAQPATSVAAAAPAGDGWKKTAGIGALAGGGLLAIGGVVVLVMRAGDTDELSADLDAGTVSKDDAQRRLASIESQGPIGYALIGAGVAAAGLGAWWLMGSSASTSSALHVDPVGKRVVFAVRF